MKPKPISRAQRWALEDTFITMFFILFMLVGAFLIQTGSASAVSMSAKRPLATYCSDPSPHCYAEVDWFGATPGAFTNLSPYGSMECSGCTGFVDNEMWFEDAYSSQCYNTTLRACWVEAGIETRSADDPYDCYPGQDAVCTFWADNRPNGGGFHHHTLYTVGLGSVDLNPWYFFVKIRNNSGNSNSGDTWAVTVQGFYNNAQVENDTGTSTNNSMSPSDIVIGSELDNPPPGGLPSVGEMDFQYNQWLDTNGTWHEQTSSATNTSTNPPPSGWWTQLPNSTNGGIWSTGCC